VLTKYASCVGNFSEISDLVISKIPFGDVKMTYKHGNYLYHYIQQEGLVFLCITEEGFGQKDAFQFLDKVQSRFNKRFALRAQTASAYSLNTEFSLIIREEMDRFNKPNQEHDKINMIQEEVNQVKDIMVRNIDDLVERGEKLDLLVDKTDNLSATAVTFKTTTRAVHHQMWWKNIRWSIAVGVAVLICLYIIISLSCGGMAWEKCV
jgi:vesicle-associated membrane protein 7